MHVFVYDAIKWPASTWLSSLVCRARHRYHRGYASWVKLPHSLKFFSLLLKLCLLLQISSSSSSKNLCRYLMYPVISPGWKKVLSCYAARDGIQRQRSWLALTYQAMCQSKFLRRVQNFQNKYGILALYKQKRNSWNNSTARKFPLSLFTLRTHIKHDHI